MAPSRWLRRARAQLVRRRPHPPGSLERRDQVLQRLIVSQWRALERTGVPRPRWSETGFGVYSSNDEDGILLYLFTTAGTTNRVVVDIGFCTPEGSNSANLLVNWAWTGILVEGDPQRVTAANEWFAAHPSVPWQPLLINAWVEPDRIDDLLRSHSVVGEVDLLCIDIDGADLWVWDALTVIDPRVVVVEYAHFWGPDRAVSVPRDPGFSAPRDLEELYCSASLAAYVNVGKKKGYRLVAVSERRFNAFFLRDDVAPEAFPEITPAEAFADPPTLGGTPTWSEEGLPGVWVEVPPP